MVDIVAVEVIPIFDFADRDLNKIRRTEYYRDRP